MKLRGAISKTSRLLLELVVLTLGFLALATAIPNSREGEPSVAEQLIGGEQDRAQQQPTTAAASGTEEPPTPPTPTVQPISADLLELQKAMERAIAAYRVPGKYAVAVTDLQTGETVSVNGDVPHLSGCVVNLFVLIQVARDVNEGKYTLAQIDSLVRSTTWSSNAVTARELYRTAGGGDAVVGVRRVESLVRDVLGLQDIVLDHPPGYEHESIGVDANNWVTADAMNQALAALWQGRAVYDPLRDYLLARLLEVKPGLNYLTAAVPEGKVSHKNGFFPAETGWVDNDVGIIRLTWGGSEYAFALSFLSQDVSAKYGSVALGQQLSAMAYKAIAARYP